jgi:hypothetical protein
MLPCLQLVAAGDPALWLHLADEAMRFEKRCAVQVIPVPQHFIAVC